MTAPPHELPIQLIVEAWDKSPAFPRRAQTVVIVRRTAHGNSPATKEERVEEQVEFVPLPATVFVSEDKPVNSVVADAQLRHVPGTKDAVQPVNYRFEVRGDASATAQFTMHDNHLVVKSPLKIGEYQVELVATKEGEPTTEPAARHPVRISVVRGRDKYPVFERINYEFEVGPGLHREKNSASLQVGNSTSAHQLPLKLPPLNASISGGNHVSYSLVSLTDSFTNGLRGLTIDQSSGELVVMDRSFFENNVNASSRMDGNDVFVVVRATNMEDNSYFSDVGITIRVAPSYDPLAFESSLYRLIVREDQPAGSVVNTVPFILKNVKTQGGATMQFDPENPHFGILPNGSVILKSPVSLNDLPPGAKPVLSLNIVGHEAGETASARVEVAIERVSEGARETKNDKEQQGVAVKTWRPSKGRRNHSNHAAFLNLSQTN